MQMKFNQAEEKSLYELGAQFKAAIRRYWRIAIGPSIVIFGLVALLSIWLPNYFTASALIFIQPQRIHSEVVNTPDKEEMRERLEALVQEILSRQRLRAVLEKYNLYPNLKGASGMEEALYRLRNEDISVSFIKSPTGEQLFQTFQLQFTHSDSALSYDVAKALTDLFIEESMINSRREIQGTEEFLDGELSQARRELEATESKVQQFIKENFDKLPQHLEAAIARLENAQSQLANNSSLMAANSARRTSIEAELSNLKNQAPVDSSGVSADISDPFASLSQLESALVVLRSKYSSQHPDVLAVEERIRSLKSGLDSQGVKYRNKGPSAATSATGVGAGLRAELREINAQLVSLNQENEILKRTIAKLEANIEEMPIKEQELLKIKRDYTNVKSNYEQLLGAKKDASLEASLVRSQKAPQFRIIEAPEPPITPAGPNRGLLLGVGAGVSLLLFLLIPLLLFLLNTSFKLTEEVEQVTQLPVLGVVPPMETPDALMFRKRLISSSALASVVSFIGGCVLIFLTV